MKWSFSHQYSTTTISRIIETGRTLSASRDTRKRIRILMDRSRFSNSSAGPEELLPLHLQSSAGLLFFKSFNLILSLPFLNLIIMKYSQAILVACVGGAALVSAFPPPPAESGVTLATQPTQDTPSTLTSGATDPGNPPSSQQHPKKHKKATGGTQHENGGQPRKQRNAKKRLRYGKGMRPGNRIPGDGSQPVHPHGAQGSTNEGNRELSSITPNTVPGQERGSIAPPGQAPLADHHSQHHQHHPVPQMNNRHPGPHSANPPPVTIPPANAPPIAPAPIVARDFEDELFVRDLDEELFSRAFDDDLETRGLLTKFTQWRADRNQKKAVKLQEKADKAAQKAATYGAAAGAGTAPTPSDQGTMVAREFDEGLYSREFDEDLFTRDFDEDIFARDVGEELYARDFEEDVFARDFEDEVFARDFDEEVYARDFDEGLHARDFDEELYARDFDEDLYARDFDEGLYARDFDEDLFTRAVYDELEARSVSEKINQWRMEHDAKKAAKLQAEANKASQKAATYRAMSGTPPPDPLLASRNFDDELFAREFDEELLTRDLDEGLLSRDYDEELFARDLENELVARGALDKLREWFGGGTKPANPVPAAGPPPIANRDIDEELSMRDLIDELDTRDLNELD